MQSKIIALVLVSMATSNLPVKIRYEKDDICYKKCFVGRTLFLPGNLTENSTRPLSLAVSKGSPDFKSEGASLAPSSFLLLRSFSLTSRHLIWNNPKGLFEPAGFQSKVNCRLLSLDLNKDAQLAASDINLSVR